MDRPQSEKNTFKVENPAVRILTPLLLTLVLTTSGAQTNQSEYLEAKRQYSLGNYRDAMGNFQSLTGNPVFGAYASFYYALSAYHQELPKVALDMWKQILSKYSGWDQESEVNFWIAKTSFEKKRYLDGVNYANKLPEDVRKSLLISVQDDLDLQEIDALYLANLENESLAILYFQALSNQPYQNRDHDKLLFLSKKFEFDLDDLISDFPKINKDRYTVVLVLPFMFDSLQNSQSVIQNRIIFELYQGMKLAQDSLLDEGITLDLYPFDTQKLGSRTIEILKNEALKKTDLIVGPLYTSPSEIVSKFSRENEIPMINPLSSNGSIIGDNTFSFLFKPSYETQGRKGGEYAAKKFSNNKNAIIFFETGRDLVLAEAYRKTLEKDSFNIVLFGELTKEFALQFQADWTHQYKDLLDSLTQEEIDSITLIPNRYVRTRPKRDEETGRVMKDRNGENRIEYYEMRFTIPEDTIGHIFVATSSNLLSNNILSLTEVRSDSIGIVGYDDWLKFGLVSFNQLERLRVSMIHTSYFSEEKSGVVEDKIRTTFWTEPTEYHLVGFELIMQVGHLFDEHGKHFQRGLLTGKYQDGYLMEGLNYGSYRDNQIVPIITIQDLNVLVENRDQYED